MEAREIDRAIGAMSVMELWNRQKRDHELLLKLSEPLPNIPDAPVRVRVLHPFLLGAPHAVPSRNAIVGEVLELPTTIAADMIALGRAAPSG